MTRIYHKTIVVQIPICLYRWQWHLTQQHHIHTHTEYIFVFPQYNLYAPHHYVTLYVTLYIFFRIDLEKPRAAVFSARHYPPSNNKATIIARAVYNGQMKINCCNLMDLYLSKPLLWQPFRYWTRSWTCPINFTSQLISLEICIKVIISKNTANINWVLHIHAFFLTVFLTNWRCSVIMRQSVVSNEIWLVISTSKFILK